MSIYSKHNFNDNANQLLNTIDPFNNKQINYSECVNLFSNETCENVDGKGKKVDLNVLDKVSLDDSILGFK